MTAARYVTALVWRDARLALTSRVPFLFDVLGLLSALTVFFFVGRFVGRAGGATGAGFLGFVTAGIAAMQLQAAVMRAIHGIDREQASGGLEFLLVAPVRAAVVGLAATAFPLARGLVFAVAALIAGRFVFGVQLTISPRAWAAIALGLAGAALAFVVLALLCFAVLVAIQQGPAAAGLIGVLVPVLSGVYFPTSLLPQPLEAIASASPLTMAIEVLRRAVTGSELRPGTVVAMFAMLAVLLVLSAALCEAVVRRAKRLGTLGHG